MIKSIIQLTIIALFLGCRDSGTGPFDLDPPSPPPVQVAEWDFVGLEEVSAIAIVPQKPWVIFAGTMSDFSAGTRGKIFRSNDWGRTWREVVRDVSVTRIVVDPKNPWIVYAALAWVNFTAPGVIKSTDGGFTWFRSDSGMYFDESGIGALVIDPANTNTLYAGKSGFFSGALYKTTNGGSSWFGIPDEQPYPLGGGVTALAIDPTNTNIIYAGTAWGSQIFKSTDSGMTWRLTSFDSPVGPRTIVVSPWNSFTLYCGGNFLWNNRWGIYRSTDRGGSWHMMPRDGLPDTVSVGTIVLWTERNIFVTANWRDNGGGVSNDGRRNFLDVHRH